MSTIAIAFPRVDPLKFRSWRPSSAVSPIASAVWRNCKHLARTARHLRVCCKRTRLPLWRLLPHRQSSGDQDRNPIHTSLLQWIDSRYFPSASSAKTTVPLAPILAAPYSERLSISSWSSISIIFSYTGLQLSHCQSTTKLTQVQRSNPRKCAC